MSRASERVSVDVPAAALCFVSRRRRVEHVRNEMDTCPTTPAGKLKVSDDMACWRYFRVMCQIPTCVLIKQGPNTG